MTAPTTTGTSSQAARFTALGGPLVCLVGLHGGAGTTRLAQLLANARAQRSPTGRVLLTETDPAGGGLARATRARTALGLSELANAMASDAPPTAPPFTVSEDGVRILANRAGARTAAAVSRVAALLATIREQHGLVVVDGGTLREPHAQAALVQATHVIWVTSASRGVHNARAQLASSLARAATGARWAIAVNHPHPADRGAARPYRELTDTAERLVLIPHLDDPVAQQRAGEHLTSWLA